MSSPRATGRFLRENRPTCLNVIMCDTSLPLLVRLLWGRESLQLSRNGKGAQPCRFWRPLRTAHYKVIGARPFPRHFHTQVSILEGRAPMATMGRASGFPATWQDAR